MWKTLKFKLNISHLLKWFLVFTLLVTLILLGYYFYNSNFKSPKNTFNSSAVINSLFSNQEESSLTYAYGNISEIAKDSIILQLLDGRNNRIEVFVNKETKFQEIKEQDGSKIFNINDQLTFDSLKEGQRISLVLNQKDSKLVAKEINIEEEKK